MALFSEYPKKDLGIRCFHPLPTWGVGRENAELCKICSDFKVSQDKLYEELIHTQDS